VALLVSETKMEIIELLDIILIKQKCNDTCISLSAPCVRLMDLFELSQGFNDSFLVSQKCVVGSTMVNA